jgi:hypothetical protein
MIYIRLPYGEKWHRLVDGHALCGVPGDPVEQRGVALSDFGDRVCLNCDNEARRRGRASKPRRPYKPKDKAAYRPKNRERFQ